MLAAAPQGPGDSALLASRLSTALEQSGLFYESHQARWLAGKLDTAALMQEPQGRSPMPPATPAAAPGGTETITTPRAANEGLAPIPERLLPLVHQQLDAVQLHFGAAVLAEQHLVADLDLRRAHLAVVQHLAGAHGDHFALDRLLGGAVGDHDATRGQLLFFHALDDHAVVQRLDAGHVQPLQMID